MFGVYLQAGPLVPWIKQHVLGNEEAAAVGGLHFGWMVLAIAVVLLSYTYMQAIAAPAASCPSCSASARCRSRTCG